ncbi:MAG: hypothetical protein E7376_01795 [Clostridiales bacterium]|nr:hypothetical protein [Clostridiales bacterium]
MRKLKKMFVTVGVIASLTPFLAGCNSNYKEKRADELNTQITHVLKGELESQEAYDLLDFKLIGTDVAKTAFDYGVKFNGVASLSNGESAYASLNYSIPSTEFLKLEKRSSAKQVYNLLDKIVQQYKPVSYSITPVTNLVNINDAFVKNAPTPFKGYNIKDALVYNLAAPEFNDEDKTISFDVKTLMEVDKVKIKPGWGLCVGFSGPVCFGFGMPIAVHSNGTFTTIDKYVIKVDDKTYEAMKANPKAIYDACAEKINGKNNLEMKADRKLTSYVTYDEADLLDIEDIHSLNNDLSR